MLPQPQYMFDAGQHRSPVRSLALAPSDGARLRNPAGAAKRTGAAIITTNPLKVNTFRSRLVFTPNPGSPYKRQPLLVSVPATPPLCFAGGLALKPQLNSRGPVSIYLRKEPGVEPIKLPGNRLIREDLYDDAGLTPEERDAVEAFIHHLKTTTEEPDDQQTR